jgi:hypothetical protein
MAKILALNLGCGNDYRESNDEIQWVNADKGECKVDLFIDIEKVPYYLDFPNIIPTDYFDRIDAIQVLEHIEKYNFDQTIRQLYRISKNKAEWHFHVPHGLSDNFITDPTHKMPFSTRTFDYFIDGTQLRENGIIYGWGNIKLHHVTEPFIDGNQSIHFCLRVIK